MLAALREEVGMSQRQLARAMGVSHSHVSRVESGERELVDPFWTAAARAIASHLRGGAA